MRISTRDLAIRVFSLLLTLSLAAAVSPAQQRTKPRAKEMPPEKLREMSEKGMKPPTGPSFYIEALGDDHANFSLLLSDENNRTVAGTFMRSQVEIFEALMVEAKKFAESDEAVGVPGRPQTTRFVDKDEKSFIIDVEKAGPESRFYITMNTLQGTLTLYAGAIKRGGKKNSPLFYSVLTRVQTERGAPPHQ
jgi:hypothetical protein